MVDLQRGRNPSIESSSEKAVKINVCVTAGYNRKVYIGKVLEIADSDAKIPFYEHAGTLSTGSIFCEPKKWDEIWVDFVNILYIVPVPSKPKRRKKFEKVVLENVMYERIKFCMEE